MVQVDVSHLNRFPSGCRNQQISTDLFRAVGILNNHQRWLHGKHMHALVRPAQNSERNFDKSVFVEAGHPLATTTDVPKLSSRFSAGRRRGHRAEVRQSYDPYEIAHAYAPPSRIQRLHWVGVVSAALQSCFHARTPFAPTVIRTPP